MLFKIFLLLFVIENVLGISVPGKVLETKLGKIVGVDSATVNGLPYTSFFGIRYAQPPVGPLFLQKPVPALPWNDTFVADEEISCLQLGMGPFQGLIGQDDCLVVNVHTTNALLTDPLLPVMVFIHGGGWSGGSGTSENYGAERFLDYGVVLVTLNYRLGILGFTSTNDDVIPGNMGLWDQNLALKWVQANIDAFGGDPNRVTIFGESAGSMSVSYHLLSPQSQGLFHGAIGQSGTATTVHITYDHSPIYYTRKIAQALGCESEASSEELLSCFQEAGSRSLVPLQSMFERFDRLPLVYKPVVDNFTSDPFVPENQWDMIESGNFNQVPIIIGSNSDEGLLSALNFHFNHTLLDEMAENWENEYAPLVIFHREADTLDEYILELSRIVSNYFFPGTGKPDAENILTGYKNIFSDINFSAIGSITARKMAKQNSANVYEYYYKHMGTFGLIEFLLLPQWKKDLKIWGQTVGLNLYCPEFGVAHADELFMLFKAHGFPLETVYTDEDKATSQNMLKLWTNFAKTGNPTPDLELGIVWEKLSDESNQRLEIGSGTLEMALNQDLEERIEFWDEIFQITSRGPKQD